MGSSLLRVSALFAMAPDLVLKARRRLLAAIILLTAFLLYGLLAYGKFDVSYDSFLDAEDPAILALNEYRRLQKDRKLRLRGRYTLEPLLRGQRHCGYGRALDRKPAHLLGPG